MIYRRLISEISVESAKVRLVNKTRGLRVEENFVERDMFIEEILFDREKKVSYKKDSLLSILLLEFNFDVSRSSKFSNKIVHQLRERRKQGNVGWKV